MKKALLSVILFGAVAGLSAQFVPNGNFATTSGATKWITGGGNVQIVNSVDLGSGQQLKGEDGGYFGFIQNSTTVGVLVSEKFAFSSRPASLRFLTTYYPQKAGETMGIFILFTRKNVDSNRIDTVGRWLGAVAPGVVHPWRELTLDLNNYTLPGNPDSAQVAFFATVNAGASQGTALCVDNIKFSDFTGKITDIDNYFYGKIGVQPNPVTRSSNAVVTYTLNGETNVSIEVYDLTGRKVATVFEGRESNGEHQHALNNLNLGSGTYIMKVTTGSFAQTEKFVVQ